MILHLLNFNYMKSPVKNIKVEILVPAGKRVTKITDLTPDGNNDEILLFKEEGNRAVFNVPRLYVYNMIVLKLE